MKGKREKKRGSELTIDTSTRAFAEVRSEQLRIALQFGKQGIMQFRVFLTVVVLVFACGSAVAEPKAYEVVKYKGKAEGMIFALDFGDGYPDASEMKVTDRKSGKSTRFGLDDSSEMRFVPAKQGTGKREIADRTEVQRGHDVLHCGDRCVSPWAIKERDWLGATRNGQDLNRGM